MKVCTICDPEFLTFFPRLQSSGLRPSQAEKKSTKPRKQRGVTLWTFAYINGDTLCLLPLVLYEWCNPNDTKTLPDLWIDVLKMNSVQRFACHVRRWLPKNCAELGFRDVKSGGVGPGRMQRKTESVFLEFVAIVVHGMLRPSVPVRKSGPSLSIGGTRWGVSSDDWRQLPHLEKPSVIGDPSCCTCSCDSRVQIVTGVTGVTAKGDYRKLNTFSTEVWSRKRFPGPDTDHAKKQQKWFLQALNAIARGRAFCTRFFTRESFVPKPRTLTGDVS